MWNYPARDIIDKNIGDKYDLAYMMYLMRMVPLMCRCITRRIVSRTRFNCSELKELGLLIKKESHLNNVGTSEHWAVIGARLSDQWFLKMENL